MREAVRVPGPARPSAASAADDLRAFARRLRVYLREMFPVAPRLALAVLMSAGFDRLLARLHGWNGAPSVTAVALGAWSVFAALLVLRLMDELKDLDVDRALFADRPVPSGRVRTSDVRAALLVSSVAMVVPHVGGPAVWTALGVLGYAALMFRWFFVPRLMRPRLLLTLATHNPVVPALLVHLAVVAASGRGESLAAFDLRRSSAAVVLCWAPAFAWEIARKIRAPQDEDAYVTYSRLLGPVGAVALVGTAQTCALALAIGLGLRPVAVAVIAAGWCASQAAHVRFLRRPDARTARLRPFAELFLAGVLVGALCA